LCIARRNNAERREKIRPAGVRRLLVQVLRPEGGGAPSGEGDKEAGVMIVLTKMNKERFLVNHNQIEYIELIPEAKIVMMNHDYYIVRETEDEIVRKIQDYEAKIRDIRREITVTDTRK